MKIVEEENHPLQTHPEKQILFRLPVKQDICNFLGMAHGGAISTILDFSTSVVMNLYNAYSVHLSISLYLEMINPLMLGDSVLVLAEQEKIGKKVMYASCKMYEEKSLKLLAIGKHIKMSQPVPKL